MKGSGWRMGRRTIGRTSVVMVLALGLALGFTGLATLPAQGATRPLTNGILVPRALPQYFSFGVSNGSGGVQYLNDMRSNNGTAWDFRYTYLSGGVNTGRGWPTWGSGPGNYIMDFVNENHANHYRSEFVYYQLFPSNGPNAGGEKETFVAHIADAGLMNAYYADWALAMQKLSGDNQQPIMIVEPDLWGYMQATALDRGCNTAACIPASVASSGYPDAQGFPDTVQGFAWALLHMRDKYAPNVVLALHVSCWGTHDDVSTATSTDFDAVGVGQRAAQFYNTAGLVGNPAGVSSFDLLSNDITNNDSAATGVWWDRYDKTFPNFPRYLTYIHTVATSTKRSVILWQLPMGNQYYSTLNNTKGHMQDNKAEYILSHIPDFLNAGIIGAQFGQATGGTDIYDTMRDGVTNNPPISSYECNYCNTHTSTYPDDDGGYLRQVVGAYYRNGAQAVPGGVGISPPAATQAPGGAPPGTATPAGTPQPVSTRAATATAQAAVKATATAAANGTPFALGIGSGSSSGTAQTGSGKGGKAPSPWDGRSQFLLGALVVGTGIAMAVVNERRRRQRRRAQARTVIRLMASLPRPTTTLKPKL